MLTERELRLLTAATDGYLGPTDRLALRRLLRRSGAAQKPQADAARVRNLPPQQLPAGFPSRVLQAIGDRGLCPNPFAEPARPPLGRHLPAWANLAAAASVLLLLAATSFYFFLLDGPDGKSNKSLVNKAGTAVKKADGTADRRAGPGGEDEGAWEPIDGPGGDFARTVSGPPELHGPPEPSASPDAITGPRRPPVEPFKVVKVP